MGSHLTTALHVRTENMESVQRGKDEKKKRKQKSLPLLRMMQKSILRQKSREEVKSSDDATESTKNTQSVDACCENEKFVSWVEKVSSFEQTSRDLSRQSSITSINSFSNHTDSRSLPSSRYSSSYTSWTKPFVGHMISDSFAPQSDIFDDVHNSYAVEFKEFDEYKKLRRRSSADTYKDINDIEDFEFDDFDDCVIAMNEKEDDKTTTDDEVRSKSKDKRLSGVMTSPDMAYGSMNGSEDEEY